MAETGPLLAAAPAAPSNLPEFTVGEISRAIRQTLEADFRLVRVRGEITNFKRHGSGHLYFALKDEEAKLEACCWRMTALRLGIRPEDGLDVICTGRITTYGSRSQYQLVVDRMELAGEGALLKLLEDRRKKLAAEGLFDAARKRPLPFLPEVVGVVTSPTGAVIRDIMHRLRDRFPRHVLLWPVTVQGEQAAAQVAAAIAGFNALPAGGPVPRPDVLIVARGGGSLEDLWPFNEEIVVRAAASSAIPVISAVGHETDTTLIDHAADRRAPTPTAAAEMAVPVRAELLARVLDHERRLVAGAARLLDERAQRVDGLGRGLPDPETLLETAVQRLDDRSERLGNAARVALDRGAARVAQLAARLRHPRELLAAKEQALAACGRALDRGGAALLAGKAAALDRLAADRRLGPAAARRTVEGEARLERWAALLESYSYRGVLRRGFVLARGAAGPVTSAAATAPGMPLTLAFHDGEVAARVAGAEPTRRERDSRPSPPPAKRQGSLF